MSIGRLLAWLVDSNRCSTDVNRCSDLLWISLWSGTEIIAICPHAAVLHLQFFPSRAIAALADEEKHRSAVVD